MVDVFFTILILIVKRFTMKGICKNCEAEFDYHPSQSGGVYCSNQCQGDYQLKIRFTNGVDWNNRMRKYFLKIRKYKCEVCGITEHNGKPITLQIDHIDGNRKNNTFENLRFICPNCHSQTKTWGFGNVSEDGKKRIIEGAKKGALIKNNKVW